MSEAGSELHGDWVTKVSAAFERDRWIDLHKYPVKVRMREDRLVLEGTVADVAAKRRAGVLAREIVGDPGRIEDRLRRDVGERMGDRQLRDELVNRLAADSVFAHYSLRTHTGAKFETVHDAGPDSYQIEVYAEEGAVILNGVVESLSHRRLAESLAWRVHGCEAVDNQLEVVPPQEDADDEITDALRIVLEEDPAVHAEQLRLSTSVGVVTLDGLVTTDSEQKAAILDAWSIEGVRDVASRIEVRP